MKRTEAVNQLIKELEGRKKTIRENNRNLYKVVQMENDAIDKAIERRKQAEKVIRDGNELLRQTIEQIDQLKK